MSRAKLQRLVPGYRWFQAGVVLGAIFAILLLGNTLWSYAALSRRIALERARQSLSTTLTALDPPGHPVHIASLNLRLENLVTASNGKVVWARVTEPEGGLLAQAGTPGKGLVPSQVREGLRRRQPVFDLTATPAGDAVVEAFPIRVLQPGVERQLAVVEIARLLNGDEGGTTPLHRMLLINLSAALALIASLSLIVLRFRSYVAGKQLEQEAEIARQVQRDLLPAPACVSPSVDLAAECRPASSVGGDFYDAFALDDGRIAFALGDVAGKGIPAALLMGLIHGAIRASSWSGTSGEQEESARLINRLLCERTARERYATMFWGTFDPRTGRLRYINAGHLPPMVLRASGGCPVSLTEGGPVLGLLPMAEYRQGSIRLEPGDTLIAYSDGIVEAADAAGADFGEAGIASAAQAGDSAGAIRGAILASVDRHTGAGPSADDQTLLVMRYQGQPAAAQEEPVRDLVAA